MLIAAWLILGLAIAHLMGCSPSGPARLVEAAPHHPMPAHCVQALRKGELVVLCAATRATCEQARAYAVTYGGQLGLTVSSCFERPAGASLVGATQAPSPPLD